MEQQFIILAVFVGGYLFGKASKGGLNINIHKSDNPLNQEPLQYNESLVDEMDNEVRNYYEQTNGLNKF